MDFWASLEHQLRYKSEDEQDEDIIRQLRECAETIHDTDIKMQNIYEKISESQTMEEKLCIDKNSDNDIINFLMTHFKM